MGIVSPLTLQIRPELLDGVELGAVGREKQWRATGLPNQINGFLGLVERGVIHHDETADPQIGQQHLL